MIIVGMIILGMMAAALAAAMFWSPNFEPSRPDSQSLKYEASEVIAAPEIDDRTIQIHLGDLSLEQVKVLYRCYSETPIGPLISGYYNRLEADMKAQQERERRNGYISRLGQKGYSEELLAPLQLRTLERIIEDLE